jgi:hypothetical protein
VAGLDLPERRLIADELQALQQDVRAQQLDSFNEFLKEVQVRQDEARTEQATLLQLGLQYDIEAAQRSSLSRLVPLLPPDAVQLEMTNLRLQLLKNLYSTEAEREAARQRLEALETQWHEQLRQQEADRLAELKRLLTEVPARVRREGEAQILAYKAAARQRDAAFRNSVEEAQNSRVAQDFAPATARLGVVLPAFSVPSQSIAEAGGTGQSTALAPLMNGIADGGRRRVNALSTVHPPHFDRTFGAEPASGSAMAMSSHSAALSSAVLTGSSSLQIQERRAVLIRALRALAVKDARRWSQMVVRRSGWKWEQGAASESGRAAATAMAANPVQDATREILRALKLS